MFKTSSFGLLVFLGIQFSSTSAMPPWSRSWHHGAMRPGYWQSANRPGRPTCGHGHGHGHDHDHGYDHDYRPRPDIAERPGYQPDQEDSDYDEDPSDFFGCSCFLYVENTVVFRRQDKDRKRYSCTAYGLRRCSRYCDELFQNEGLRASSEQEACDVLGREAYISWYRKNQVCGRRGPQTDIPLETPLCCRRGRPSLSCSTEGQTS
ncbi:hypothetical protein AVEN_220863-1 [Araneus ventricosus]|uniref:Uncharacterized protein n=1 Tax=Araneus ventricosus TaxID=182803 RepID=A0A4Y2JI07_ARAVE|nr:hypothetical protein AVEN_220863-1 [Araneus ventricosus]